MTNTKNKIGENFSNTRILITYEQLLNERSKISNNYNKLVRMIPKTDEKLNKKHNKEIKKTEIKIKK